MFEDEDRILHFLELLLELPQSSYAERNLLNEIREKMFNTLLRGNEISYKSTGEVLNQFRDFILDEDFSIFLLENQHYATNTQDNKRNFLHLIFIMAGLVLTENKGFDIWFSNKTSFKSLFSLYGGEIQFNIIEDFFITGNPFRASIILPCCIGMFKKEFTDGLIQRHLLNDYRNEPTFGIFTDIENMIRYSVFNDVYNGAIDESSINRTKSKIFNIAQVIFSNIKNMGEWPENRFYYLSPSINSLKEEITDLNLIIKNFDFDSFINMDLVDNPRSEDSKMYFDIAYKALCQELNI